MGEQSKKVVLIGVGLPRTGTSSLKIAFEELIGGHCYHMTSFIFEGQDFDLDHWTRAFQKRTQPSEWVEFFQKRDCISCVDFPPAYFFKEIVEAFPEAKVVLSLRNPVTWHESVEASIMRTQHILRSFPASIVVGMKPGMTERLELAHKLSTTAPKGFSTSLFGSIRRGQIKSAEFYDQWLSEVRRMVSEDKLLEFDVKAGWEPLCQFLGVSIPDKPFPRANDRESMAKTINRVQNIGWAIVFGTPVLLGMFGFLMIYIFLSSLGT